MRIDAPPYPLNEFNPSIRSINMKLFSITGFIAVLSLTGSWASAQQYCSGPNCPTTNCLSADPTCGTGGDPESGLLQLDDSFANFIFEYGYSQSLANNMWNINRRECYANCRKTFKRQKADCIAEFGWLTGTQDAYNICISVAREEVEECISPNSFLQCNEEFP